MFKELCKDEGRIVPTTRILLVDDHEPFRRFIRAALGQREGLRLVCETSDGLDAVSKCRELEPDLVLMDIGLPGLNGFEAARKILALAPACKIVFLTQEGSPEMVEEALNLGAAGYVLKAHAASELLPAVLGARDGRPFLSTVMARCNHAPDAARNMACGNSVHETQHSHTTNHAVQFHSDDASLLLGFASFVEEALKAGSAAIVLLTEAHRPVFLRYLQARGVDADPPMNSGRLVLHDVEETLGEFMVDGMPDPARFFRVAGDMVRAVKTANRGASVVACGECSPTLWARGNGYAAVHLECLWDRLGKMHDLEILCGYVLNNSQRERQKNIYEWVCAAHSTVSSV